MPALGSEASSTHKKYPAVNLIDGDLSTRTKSAKAVGNWVSVRVADNTPIGYVAVHNAQGRHGRLLGSFDVWVGSQFGDTTSADASRCGGAAYDATSDEQVYVIWCGVSTGSYVTVKQTGSKRTMSLSECTVYMV